MPDLLSEELLPLAEASRTLPQRPCAATLWRWHKKGVRGIRLETVVICGRRHTSKAAVWRFIQRTTAARSGIDPNRTVVSRDRQAAIRKAEAELEAAGI